MKYFLQATTLTLGMLVTVGAILTPHAAHAQEGQALSVTPPFAQMVVLPGDTFRSYVKVINPNAYPLTVFVTPVNFATGDEDGHPKFIPLIDQEVDKATMAGWIDVTRDPLVIAPESSVNVNYLINVPGDAQPGGHFAALLIGTRPPDTAGASAIRTSQVVSALFLARVEGDILEGGQIREFSVTDWFSSTPRAELALRFENIGNVYIQPQGDITIFNMWGKERGFIPVNQKTNFGNVLPKSIRKFSFEWEGTPSITDIGRYSAVATLSYGVNGKQSVDRTLHFWVIPVKATLITLGFIIGFIVFITFSIKLYVRRALQLAGHTVERVPGKTTPRTLPSTKRIDRRVMSAPLKEGVLDLRRSVKRQPDPLNAEKGDGLRSFISRYRKFFGAVSIGIVGLGLIFWYVLDARTEERPYEVKVKHSDGTTTITSEEVLRDRLDVPEDRTSVESEAIDDEPLQLVSIVNASGVPGTGAEIALRLEQRGYRVADISTDADGRDRSAIIFNASKIEVATLLSEVLDGTPLSARPEGEETEPEVLVIIGRDLTD